MKIIERKNITIANDLGISKSWDSNIILNFVPDQMIVKSIVSNGNGVVIDSVALVCPTINEVLGAFYNNNCIVYPNLVLDARNYPINTRWSFQIRNVNGNLNTTFNGHLFVQLEFIKLG